MLVLSRDILDKLRGFYFVVSGRFCGNRVTASLSTEQELSHNSQNLTISSSTYCEILTTRWTAPIGDYSVLSFSVLSIDRTLNKTANFALYQKIMIFTFSQCNSNLNLAS